MTYDDDFELSEWYLKHHLAPLMMREITGYYILGSNSVNVNGESVRTRQDIVLSAKDLNLDNDSTKIILPSEMAHVHNVEVPDKSFVTESMNLQIIKNDRTCKFKVDASDAESSDHLLIDGHFSHYPLNLFGIESLPLKEFSHDLVFKVDDTQESDLSNITEMVSSHLIKLLYPFESNGTRSRIAKNSEITSRFFSHSSDGYKYSRPYVSVQMSCITESTSTSLSSELVNNAIYRTAKYIEKSTGLYTTCSKSVSFA